jgi:hypothetical protein
MTVAQLVKKENFSRPAEIEGSLFCSDEGGVGGIPQPNITLSWYLRLETWNKHKRMNYRMNDLVGRKCEVNKLQMQEVIWIIIIK